MKTKLLAVAAALMLPQIAVAANAPTAAEQAAIAKAKALLESLHPQSGDVAVPTAHATLHLGKAYYFLPADDARRVLVEAWGNPSEAADGVLGLVIPAGKTPYDDTWGAVVTYEETGHVKDDDAKTTDYDEVLRGWQDSEPQINERRKAEGFPEQHIVGWAQPPSYDPRSHSMVWARNIAFSGQPENSLNYDVRLLGRTGVLSLNLLTGMSKLVETRASAATLAQTASFDTGARYADYQPGTDKLADYGLAGLVAGGVGVVAAKKLGLLAIMLGVGKKLIVVLLAGFALAGRKIKSLFGRGEPDPVYDEADGDQAAE
ncbi:DUF2167 domain-containing protein [Sphingomonas sp.]|uniref:DUF2167 domain-containing protein n=1 Tax=Sphingomonas sp. TaxID=28214 RepID=UPI002DB63EE7|nr:DUF2167 domain-containing protein [Sphingomonas sp.]HEU4968190.1 DUF2167 domain-containing protein [Sphingomonas sp.]